MATLPEGFSSWDEYDAYRKSTGPSMRSAYPNKITESVATNPVTNFLVPGAEKFLQRGGAPSAWDLGIGILDVATGPIPAGALLGSLAKKPLTKAASAHLERWPQILDEITEGILKFTKNPNRSSGIVERAKELNRYEKGRAAGYPGGRHPSKAEQQVRYRERLARKAEANPSSLTQKEAGIVASDRARGIIRNMREREFAGPSGGKSYLLTKEDEKRLHDALYPHKLREVLEGTPYGMRMSVPHDYPIKAVLARGGEQVGSGYTNLANLTDEFGNFTFVPQSKNASLGNVVPEKYLSPTLNLLNLK